MKTSNRARRNWKIVFWLSLGSALISAYYGYRVATTDNVPETTPLTGIATGIASSLAIATPIILFELWGQRLTIVRRLRRLPLVAYLGFRVVLYVGIIVVGLVAARLLVGTQPFAFNDIFEDFAFAVAMSVLTNIAIEVGYLLGFRTIKNLLTGRYVRPRREDRVFLLIDMKNSTGVAERLGPIRFHQLLNDFFDDISDAALECEAEIHKYVGDEAILTWPADRAGQGGVVACPFIVHDLIIASGGKYRRRFGVEPEFRAALHCGEIVAGQIGAVRREIAYVGDTLNVAARLLEAAKEVGRDVLVSTDLLARTTLPSDIVVEPLPTLAVRGRETPLGIAALSRA
jgi:adenylate cyclase